MLTNTGDYKLPPDCTSKSGHTVTIRLTRETRDRLHAMKLRLCADEVIQDHFFSTAIDYLMSLQDRLDAIKKERES